MDALGTTPTIVETSSSDTPQRQSADTTHPVADLRGLRQAAVDAALENRDQNQRAEWVGWEMF